MRRQTRREPGHPEDAQGVLGKSLGVGQPDALRPDVGEAPERVDELSVLEPEGQAVAPEVAPLEVRLDPIRTTGGKKSPDQPPKPTNSTTTTPPKHNNKDDTVDPFAQ